VSRTFAIAAVCALAWMRPAVGAAQSAHIEAEIRSQQASEAARRGEVDEAIRLYRLSIVLNATPRTWRELALVYEHQASMRLAADAWTHYAATAISPDERDQAITRRESLRRTSSLLRVRVSPVIAGREARVWFDRDRPRVMPVGGAESFVEGGSHRVRVEAPGYLPFETMVATAYGEPVEVIARMVASGGGDATGAGTADAGARR
jgi:hypothetical protein